MQTVEFSATVAELREDLLKATEAFCQARGLAFERTTYLDQQSTDWEQTSREMLFFGSDHWPTINAS